jgi:hypothetical protein
VGYAVIVKLSSGYIVGGKLPTRFHTRFAPTAQTLVTNDFMLFLPCPAEAVFASAGFLCNPTKNL